MAQDTKFIKTDANNLFIIIYNKKGGEIPPNLS